MASLKVMSEHVGKTNPEAVSLGQKTGEQVRQEAIARDRLESAPVLAELKTAGFDVQHIDDLYSRRLSYKPAIPVLIKWLPIVATPYVKESIVRALSVAWAKPAAAPCLIVEFRNAPPRFVSSLKWAIGNALSVVADDSVFDQVADLAQDRTHGRAREMVVVALGNMKDPRAVDVLLELLNDDEVAGNALIALRKLNVKSTRPAIEPFVRHPTTWVRNEAKRTLAKLDKPPRSTPHRRKQSLLRGVLARLRRPS